DRSRVSRCNSCFFFQAEDGIRDRTVTGVQTCALPILHAIETGGNDVADIAEALSSAIVRFHLRTMERLAIEYDFLPRESEILRRSEERRVGKECRCRWWGEH